MTPSAVGILCASFQEERIREKIELVEWYLAKGEKKTAALVHGVSAPTLEGSSVGGIDDQRNVFAWKSVPNRLSDPQPAFVGQRADIVARGDGASKGWTGETPVLHAVRFSVTTGRCRRLPWKVSSHANWTPGLPLTKVTGFAQGDRRGQLSRGSNRG